MTSPVSSCGQANHAVPPVASQTSSTYACAGAVNAFSVTRMRSQPSVGSSLPTAASVVPVSPSLLTASNAPAVTGRIRRNAPPPVRLSVLTYAESVNAVPASSGTSCR